MPLTANIIDIDTISACPDTEAADQPATLYALHNMSEQYMSYKT